MSVDEFFDQRGCPLDSRREFHLSEGCPLRCCARQLFALERPLALAQCILG